MTSGTATSSGRRKYQPSNINTSGTTGTTTLARRSQTMKVSKLMNGNPRLPPSTPSSYHSYRPPGYHNTMNSRQKERPTSFHDSPFTSSSSTHRLDEQSGHSLKTQTLNTRRGGTVTNCSKTPSTLFRNSSVCNLERDIGPTVTKSTKSGTVLLENRRKGVGSASTTSLWDDQNYIHRYNGNGKLGNGTKSSTKNGMLNVSPNHRHHQSLHHLPSSTPSSSSSSADSSPNNNQRSNLSKKLSLCHLPPPDYSDSGNNSFHLFLPPFVILLTIHLFLDFTIKGREDRFNS